jgi:hypothetical protein
MGRIDEAIAHIEQIGDGTERAFQLAGLISTLFKLKGVVLIVTGHPAFEIYANATSDHPAVELAVFSGTPTPRIVLEVMRGQLYAKGGQGRWKIAGITVRLLGQATILYPALCRDFNTDHGVVKLVPAEELTAECVLASIHPEPDFEAQTRARLLLINGLTEAFQMDWPTLQTICTHPDYRVGEELAQMRAAAKKDVDVMGAHRDDISHPDSLG